MFRPLNVLLGCEESQEVQQAFSSAGHDSYSCDLLPTSGKSPEKHIQDDIMNHIFSPKWDLKICFPPCDHLSVSGARWFKDKREDGRQEKAIRFFFTVWKYSHCCENPIGILNGGKYIKKWFPQLYSEMKDYGFPFKPSQIIQPWQFGHGETKATCLWLNDLPLLEPTEIVEGREQRIWKLPPSKDRSKLRSKTYKGIAKAMADQWGNIIS